VYLTRPAISGPQPWDHWTPDIVVEVVSEGGEERDYQVKRDEYLTAGVRVYWIVDAGSHQVTELVRSGDIWGERRLGRDDALSTTLLPGFNVPLATVFAAD